MDLNSWDSVPSLSNSSRKTSSLDPSQGGASVLHRGTWFYRDRGRILGKFLYVNFITYATFDFGLCCTIGSP